MALTRPERPPKKPTAEPLRGPLGPGNLLISHGEEKPGADMSDPPIREGQILTGPLFSEPVRVETVAPNGPGAWTLGVVGTQTERFRRVSLTRDQLATPTILSPPAPARSRLRLPAQGRARPVPPRR